MSRNPKSFDESYSNKIKQAADSDFQDVKEQVSDIAAKTKEKVGQVSEALSDKLDEQRTNAADGLGRVASTIHEKADSIPGGATVADFTHSIADGMESTANYLREHDFSDMSKDVMSICRKYPIQSMVAALAVGFLVGRSRR